MNCVKCGREIGEDQVFCELCLAEMEHYPVKPGTAIHIPTRTTQVETKKQPKRKPLLTPAEQILRLRKKVQGLRIVVTMLLLLCGLLCFLFGRMAMELDFQRLLGQNFRTEQSVEREQTGSLFDIIFR